VAAVTFAEAREKEGKTGKRGQGRQERRATPSEYRGPSQWVRRCA
jgi:hypothetical protein